MTAIPLPSSVGAESQLQTIGQPTDSSVAILSLAVPELSATGLVQTQVATQSMDPSSHTVSTAGSTTATTVPATTTEAALIVSALPALTNTATLSEAEQAVDEAAAKSLDDADLDFHIRAATRAFPFCAPPPSSS